MKEKHLIGSKVYKRKIHNLHIYIYIYITILANRVWFGSRLQKAPSSSMRSNWINSLQSDNLKDASKDEGFPLTHCVVSTEYFALISSDDKRTTLESEYNTDVRGDWWSEGGGRGEVYRAKPLDTSSVYLC